MLHTACCFTRALKDRCNGANCYQQEVGHHSTDTQIDLDADDDDDDDEEDDDEDEDEDEEYEAAAPSVLVVQEPAPLSPMSDGTGRWNLSCNFPPY